MSIAEIEVARELEPSRFKDANEAVASLTKNSDRESGYSLPNPFSGGLENQYWKWNKIAGQFIKLDRPDQALEIWSAMYLSYLATQLRYHHRLHKGMALCNIGYALGRMQGQRVNQAKSWILGIIEDIFTDVENVEERLSYKNLLSTPNVTEPRIRQLVSAVRLRILDETITPLFPETCVDFFVNPATDSPSDLALKRIEELETSVRSASPELVTEAGSYWKVLEKCWSFLDWSKGVTSVH